MSKKRTRADKERAIHPFTVSWTPAKSSLKTSTKSANVNSQLNTIREAVKSESAKGNLATFSDKNPTLASVKKDIVKSLILVAFILASEVMIYLNWTRILSIRFG